METLVLLYVERLSSNASPFRFGLESTCVGEEKFAQNARRLIQIFDIFVRVIPQNPIFGMANPPQLTHSLLSAMHL